MIFGSPGMLHVPGGKYYMPKSNTEQHVTSKKAERHILWSNYWFFESKKNKDKMILEIITLSICINKTLNKNMQANI